MNNEKWENVSDYLPALFPYLVMDGANDIVINQECEVFVDFGGHWEKFDKSQHDNALLTSDYLSSFCRAIAAYSHNDWGEHAPILSAQFPTGERVQCVHPPVVNQISMTIRKPSNTVWSLNDLARKGFFKPPYTDAFFEQAVLDKKTIIIIGDTGSGKSTMARACLEAVPKNERIITIEDVSEISSSHENQINLFYPSEAKINDVVTPTLLLKSCLRMNPDRILLGELRGAEAFDFINTVISGHAGSITTCHALSCELAFDRLALLIMQNPMAKTLSYDVIMRILHDVIDLIVLVENDKVGKGEQPPKGRHIKDVWVKK